MFPELVEMNKKLDMMITLIRELILETKCHHDWGQIYRYPEDPSGTKRQKCQLCGLEK